MLFENKSIYKGNYYKIFKSYHQLLWPAKPAQSKLQSQKGSSTRDGLVLRNNTAGSLVWKYKEKMIYFRRMEVKMGQELFHKESVKTNANRVGSVEFSAPRDIQKW